MEEELELKLRELRVAYIGLPEESLELVYQLFVHNVVGKPTTGIEYYYYGDYYMYVVKDNDQTVMHYSRAIELGCVEGLSQLGFYYFHRDTNHELAVRYLLKGIKLGNWRSSVVLGIFYQYMRPNYPLMKKYYHLGIARGNNVCMANLALYYEEQETNFVLMERYYLMAIERGSGRALSKLTDYYLCSTPTWEHFDFALTHQLPALLDRNYLPEYVHHLIKVRDKNLSVWLLKEKQSYAETLFLSLRTTDTYFSPGYCVKDVTEMIKAYL